MLKIRTFLFALLGVSPLLFLSWQLPNQAKVLPTHSHNESATLSGYPTPIAQASPSSTFDSPSKGTAGSLSGGGTTGSSATVFSVPTVNIITAPPVAASPQVSVSVTNGVVSITVTPAATQVLNAAAAQLLIQAASGTTGGGTTGGGTTGGGTTGGGDTGGTTGGGTTGGGDTGGTTGGGTTGGGDTGGTTGGGTTGGGDTGGTAGGGADTVVTAAIGGADAPAAVQQLTSALSATGLSPTLVTNLLQNIAGLFSAAEVSTTPSFPSAQLPQAQLVAGTKDLKSSLTIAQANTAPTVNINKLNNAINAYNQIVLESSPVVLQKLSQDKYFLEIGRTLKTLRGALK